MKKALIMSHDMNDATSYYRAAGAFSYLRCDNWQFDFVDLKTTPISAIDWAVFAPYSLVYMQRPHTDLEYIYFRCIKEMGIQVWVDYDDDIWSLLLGNPFYLYYNLEEVQNRVDNFIRFSDYASCSTEGVREAFQGRRDKPIEVIPNAFNDIARPSKKSTPTEFKSQWVWRGSESHAPDLDAMRQDFVKVLEKDPKHTNIFWGSSDWKLLETIKYEGKADKRVILLDPTTPTKYIEQLSRNRAIDNAGRFGVVPLLDCKFNRAKSNIAWLEFTYSNIVTIAPAFGEFLRPGVVNYTKEQDMADTYFDLVKYGDPVGQIDMSWEYIMEHYRLSKTNIKRFNLLQEAYDCTL